MNNKIKTTLPLAALLAVAACGKESDQPAGGSNTEAAKPAWNATDACALLDKADVGAALNDTVTETRLGLVNEASGANAATSECTYKLAGGGEATLMTRWSPIADNTPEVIAAARNALRETTKAFGKTIEDVPNLGKAAFFAPGINQMNVFLDDRKFVVLTLSTASNAEGKALTTALIGKIKP